jgi:quercetin dioxygenase-like cupin family protein
VAQTGDELVMGEGTRFLLHRSAQDTRGERVEWDITLQPGAPSPPLHYHPSQTEEWHVLEGALSVNIGGDWRELREGESATIPPGQSHTLENRSDGVVRVRDVHVPAGDFQEYIESLHRLSASGKASNLRSPRALVHLAMLVHDHRRRGGQVSASALQRGAETVLAAIGRLLRYEV